MLLQLCVHLLPTAFSALVKSDRWILHYTFKVVLVIYDLILECYHKLLSLSGIPYSPARAKDNLRALLHQTVAFTVYILPLVVFVVPFD
jgi:hypothetical protein